MPKNIFSVHNVSDEDVGVQGKRSNQTLQPGDRDTFRDIRNKNEVARKCVIHLNASRVYENMLEVDRNGDTGDEEVEEQGTVEQDESESSDEDETVEESDEADESDEVEDDKSEEGDEVEEVDLAETLSDFDYSDLQALAGNEDDIQGNASKDDIVEGLAEKYSYEELEVALNE